MVLCGIQNNLNHLVH